MRETFLLLVATAIACALSPYSQAEDKPALSAKIIGEIHLTKTNEHRFDVGDIPLGARVRLAIRVINDLQADIHFSDSKSSCACLVAVPSEKKVASSDETMVFVALAPKEAGRIEQRVVITTQSGDAEPGELRFAISGQCKPLLSLSPTAFDVTDDKHLSIKVAKNFESAKLDEIRFTVAGDGIVDMERPSDDTLRVNLKPVRWKADELSRTVVVRAFIDTQLVQEQSLGLNNPNGVSIRPSVATGAITQSGQVRCVFYVIANKSFIDLLCSDGDLVVESDLPDGDKKLQAEISKIKRVSDTTCVVEIALDQNVVARHKGTVVLSWQSNSLKKNFGSTQLIK